MTSDFYLCAKKDGEYHVYESAIYSLTAMEILNIIKICVKERRALTIGDKILNAYLEHNQHSVESKRSLERIGIKINGKQPTKTTKSVRY